MNVQVVCVSSRVPQESYYFFRECIESFRRFGETPVILGEGQPFRGLMEKPNLYRDWIRAGNATSDRLMLVDAWDIIAIKHPHGLGDRLEEFDCDILMNAERSCFPRGDLADQFHDPGTPWKYPNSGFIMGYTEAILTLLESMDLESIGFDRVNEDGTRTEPNDQEHFTLAYLKQPVRMKLDTNCEIAQTLSGSEMENFKFNELGVLNRITGTYPGIIHGNGSKEHIFPAILRHMNL